MRKQCIIFFVSCCISGSLLSQAVFTYGSNEVSKEEFIRAFNKNITQVENKEKSLKEYIDLYATFKLKVKAAKDMSLDTLQQLKFDMMNFRARLENDYPINISEAKTKINFKINTAVKQDELFRFTDSVTLLTSNRRYPIAKETIFSMAATQVKVSEWFSFVKAYKQNTALYTGETYHELLEKFIQKTVSDYYRRHLEEYNTEFKYQLQDFKEGNLLFEAMSKKIWNQAAADPAVLKAFYEANKNKFMWEQSADVVLVNATYYAYAEYAAENISRGQDWKNIAAESEGMIQADSGRYEIAQLPIKPGSKLDEGALSNIVKNETDNSAGFVKVLKVYPPKVQRSFEEARSMVINEYQQQLEENWLSDLKKKYPVKINTVVFQTLLK